MDLESRSFGSELFAYNVDGQDAADVDRDAASDEQKKNRVDSVEVETSLIQAVYLDSRSELAAQTKRLPGALDRATAAKLLHLCCNVDSAECAAALLGGEVGEVPLINELDESGKSPLHAAAESHSWRCVEVLLKKHARTDLRTKDGQAQLALQLSLTDTRMDQNWDPIDLCTGKDSIINMSVKGLKTLKLLSEETEVAEVAYSNAIKGRVASLIALLIVAPEKVIYSVLDFRDSESGWKKKGTIYECLIWEALALGRRTKRPLTAEEESKNSGRRKLLLQEIELLQLLGAVTYSGGKEKKKKRVTSPLIRAAQEGDEEVMQLLLKANKFDVNSTDADYNSALHWILMSSRLSCPLAVNLMNDDLPVQIKCMAQELADEETTTTRSQAVTLVNARNVNTKAEAAACSIEPQGHITKSSKDPSTPIWLKVFRMWFPGFLQGLSKDSNYALSSLKDDFMATFGLKLDHSSVGYSKLSDFLKGLSDLCTIESGSLTHMILRPKLSSTPCRLLPTPRTPHTLSLSLSIVNCGDSKDVQNSSNDSSNDAKCHQNHPGDNVFDSMCLQDFSIYSGGHLKLVEDEMCGSHGKEKQSSESSRYHEMNLKQDKTPKIKGTTCVAWVSEEFTVIGTDSRSTGGKQLVSDVIQKFFKIGSAVITIAGDKIEAENTVKHITETMDFETAEDCVLNVGKAVLTMKKEPETPTTRFLIAGVQSEAQYCCYMYDVYKKNEDRERGVDHVSTWKAIGSGIHFAGYILERMWARHSNDKPDVILEIILYALMVAALGDESTGGILSVIFIGSQDGAMQIATFTTVLEAYIFFYKKRIELPKVDKDGSGEGTIDMGRLEDHEDIVLFLFYDAFFISRKFMKKWLRKNGITARGHPLTQLRGGYYLHHVTFGSAQHCTEFFGKAVDISESTVIPFSSSRNHFKAIKRKQHSFFVARQSLEMLNSLVISEEMKKSFVLD